MRVQTTLAGLESIPGLFVCIQERCVRKGDFCQVQSGQRCCGSLRLLDVELAPAVPLDGNLGVFQRDRSDPDFLVEQREQIDPKPGLLCGGDVHPPVANVHVVQCDEQTGEEADPQPAVDADFHPQDSRGGRFDAGLVGVGIHKNNQDCRDDDEQSNDPADSEKDDFKRL